MKQTRPGNSTLRVGAGVSPCIGAERELTSSPFPALEAYRFLGEGKNAASLKQIPCRAFLCLQALGLELSDPAQGTRVLQPQRDGRVR